MISDGTYDEMNSTYRIVPREHRARSLCEGRKGGGAVVSVGAGRPWGPSLATHTVHGSNDGRRIS